MVKPNKKIFVFTVSRALKIRFGRSVNIILFSQSAYVFNLYSFSGRPTRRDYIQQTQIFVAYISLVDINV